MGDNEGERVRTSGKEWERVGSQGQKKAFKYSDFGLDFLRGMWYFFSFGIGRLGRPTARGSDRAL